jgi:hypothetical protein
VGNSGHLDVKAAIGGPIAANGGLRARLAVAKLDRDGFGDHLRLVIGGFGEPFGVRPNRGLERHRVKHLLPRAITFSKRLTEPLCVPIYLLFRPVGGFLKAVCQTEIEPVADNIARLFIQL